MSIGAIGGSSGLYTSRLASASVRSSSSTSKSISSTADTDSGFELPQAAIDLQSTLNTIMSGDGTESEKQSAVQGKIDEFKQSDEYQKIPQAMRDRMDQFEQSGGPGKMGPPGGGPGGPGGPGGGPSGDGFDSSNPLASLTQLGTSLQSTLLARFGIA